MGDSDIATPVVLENDPQDLRIEEYDEDVAYRWNSNKQPDAIIGPVRDFQLNGPAVSDGAKYETLSHATEDHVPDKVSNFLVVYGQDSSVSWELSNGEYPAEIGVVDEKNPDTELINAVYLATTGKELESATTEEIRELLDSTG